MNKNKKSSAKPKKVVHKKSQIKVRKKNVLDQNKWMIWGLVAGIIVFVIIIFS